MRLNWLEVRDFRNHRQLYLEVGPELTAVVGPNGRGKTNLLEAIHYLCSLSSPRVSSDLPLVRVGADSAFLRGEVDAAGGRFLVEVEVRSSGQNRMQVNRSPVRRKRDLRRHIRSVFSGPDDLSVIQGEPDARRRFMDEAVRTLWPIREGAMGQYERALRQRNRLLKDWDGPGEPPGLEAWDQELTLHGTALTALRATAVRKIRDRAARQFGAISGGSEETLVVAYRPSVEVEEGTPGEEMEDRLAGAFIARLRERRPDELARRTTLAGPHRDDLALSVQGLAARGFASHGEAWAAAMALRLALAEAVGEETGEAPILLLDDPFSGLDPVRRRRLAADLGHGGQVLLAVPDESHTPAGAVRWEVRPDAVVVAS